MKTALRFGIGIASLATMAAAGCVSNPLEQQGTQTSPGCYQDRFGQVPSKLDILFVKDTTNQMSSYNSEISAAVQAFVGALPDSLDLRMAVMLANEGNSHSDGHLAKNPGQTWVMSSATQTRDQLASELDAKLTYLSGDDDMVGGEAGIASVNRVLDHGMLQSARAKGFFRSDAALLVVFISDDKDQCSGNDGDKKICVRHAPAQFDGDGNLSSPAHQETVTASLVYNKLRTIQGDRPLFVGGVLNTTNDSGYADLIALAGGFTLDLGDASLAADLTSFASGIALTAGNRSDFPLSQSGTVDPSSVQVTVDGQNVASTLSGSEVDLASPANIGSLIVVSYCIQTTPPAGVTGSSGVSGTSGDGSGTSTGTDTGTGTGTATDPSSGTTGTTSTTSTSGTTATSGTTSSTSTSGTTSTTTTCTGLDCGFMTGV